MNKINKILLFFLISFLMVAGFAPTTHAEINSGFVNGLWYSSNPFYADQTVRIYTSIYNNNSFDIRGVVNFQDGDQIIGTSNFTVLTGRTEEAWTDWKATQGQHRLSAVFTKMEKLEIGKDPIAMEWNGSTPADQKFVDNAPAAPAADTPVADSSQNNSNNSNFASQINNIIGSLGGSTSSTANALVAGEKIGALNSGLSALKQFSEKGKVITEKLRTILEQQKPSSAVSDNSVTSTTGGLILQDVEDNPSVWTKIYRVILNILISILKIPPLLLAVGIIIIFFIILRAWYRIHRWRHGRY